MGFLSKAWKGVKKVVKKAARGAKKLAKKIAYADPTGLGKKAWDFSSKVGEKAMKVVGKITNALGPVGMIALSVLAPYAAPLWSAFGAAASAAGGFWGTVGSAIYNGANWIGGTLSSMTTGISEGIAHLSSGSFKAAGDAVVKGFADSFTGKAGQAAVDKGIQKAIASAAGDAAMNQAATEAAKDSFLDSQLNKQAMANQSNIAGFDPLNPSNSGKALEMSTGTMNTTAVDAAGVMAPTAAAEGVDWTGKAVDAAKQIGKAVLDSGVGQEQPYQAQSAQVGRGALMSTRGATGGGGQGSEGGGFLSQDMLRRIREQQAKMAQGFGGNY